MTFRKTDIYKPENIHFGRAYEAWAGVKWQWKDKNGIHNCPLDSPDPTVVAFYLGWTYAKRGQKEILRMLQESRSLEKIVLNQIDVLNKKVSKFFK